MGSVRKEEGLVARVGSMGGLSVLIDRLRLCVPLFAEYVIFMHLI